MSTVALVDNFFNEIQNPAHVITASEEEVGHEAWRVADGRRSAFDYWTGETPNTAQWVKVDCATSKAADCLFIDRDHNLEGKTVKLQKSTDDFATNTVDVVSVTFPSSASAGTALSASNGAYTEEGAWAKSFTSTSSRYWRLHVAAAASYTPRLVGLYLGAMFAPTAPLQLPFEPESVDIGYRGEETDFGWEGSALPWNRRSGELVWHLDSGDVATARTFFQQVRRPRSFWLVHSIAAAERAVFARTPPQRASLTGPTSEWFHGTLSLQWREWEPKLL